jgi:hypothetical protein
MSVSVRRALGPALVVVCWAAAAGCSRGPALVPVTGTLTKGGQPVADVMIQLAPEGGPADGKVAYGHADASGAFAMKTLPHGDGVVAGTYRVTLQPDDGSPATRLVPGKFRDLGQTPWRVTVPPAGLGGLKLDITQDTVTGAAQ